MMKTILLANRLDPELSPLTEITCAALLRVAGKPLLIHAIESIAAARLTELFVVVSPFADHVEKMIGDGALWGMRFTYVKARGDECPDGLIRRFDASLGEGLLVRNQVFDIASALNPSERGELEIRDVNLNYLRAGNLRVEKTGRGITWLDTGTHDALLQASNFIQAIEERQGLRVACVEESAWRVGYITGRDVLRLATAMGNSSYGQYLMRMLEQEV